MTKSEFRTEIFKSLVRMGLRPGLAVSWSRYLSRRVPIKTLNEPVFCTSFCLAVERTLSVYNRHWGHEWTPGTATYGRRSDGPSFIWEPTERLDPPVAKKLGTSSNGLALYNSITKLTVEISFALHDIA